MKSPHPLLAAATLALAFTTVHAQGNPMDKTALITRQPFDVKILANGQDVTATSPVTQVQYNADGTGTRTLRDSRIITGSWKFLNPQQTQVEVQGPEGSSRWVIIELNERLYRKVNIDTGVEFVHLPKGR